MVVFVCLVIEVRAVLCSWVIDLNPASSRVSNSGKCFRVFFRFLAEPDFSFPGQSHSQPRKQPENCETSIQEGKPARGDSCTCARRPSFLMDRNPNNIDHGLLLPEEKVRVIVDATSHATDQKAQQRSRQSQQKPTPGRTHHLDFPAQNHPTSPNIDALRVILSADHSICNQDTGPSTTRYACTDQEGEVLCTAKAAEIPQGRSEFAYLQRGDGEWVGVCQFASR